MMNELFRYPIGRDFFEDGFGGFRNLPDMIKMHTDIIDEGNNYKIEVDLPGFSKEDISVHMEDGLLTISAKKEENAEEKDDKKYLRRERVTSAMKRQFKFDDVAEDEIKATFKDGILDIILPKTEKVEKKKIIEIE